MLFIELMAETMLNEQRVRLFYCVVQNLAIFHIRAIDYQVTIWFSCMHLFAAKLYNNACMATFGLLYSLN